MVGVHWTQQEFLPARNLFWQTWELGRRRPVSEKMGLLLVEAPNSSGDVGPVRTASTDFTKLWNFLAFVNGTFWLWSPPPWWSRIECWGHQWLIALGDIACGGRFSQPGPMWVPLQGLQCNQMLKFPSPDEDFLNICLQETDFTEEFIFFSWDAKYQNLELGIVGAKDVNILFDRRDKWHLGVGREAHSTHLILS